jgi:hypothetical protein
MLLQPVILGSQNATSAVNGATTEPRIRINRPDDENARCRVSRVRVQPKNFSQPTQPLTTLSTSNAISPPQKRTEPSGPRRCRRGATSSLRREPNMPADLLRALFGNVTVPGGASRAQGPALSPNGWAWPRVAEPRFRFTCDAPQRPGGQACRVQDRPLARRRCYPQPPAVRCP